MIKCRKISPYFLKKMSLSWRVVANNLQVILNNINKNNNKLSDEPFHQNSCAQRKGLLLC